MTNPLAPTHDCGFVYVATGAKYFHEASDSARSLRRHHPASRICLITDRVHGACFWDDLIVLEQPRMGFRDKLEMQRAPYARAVFLDTDTTVCGDLGPLFVLLTRYEICGVQYCEGQDYVMEGGIPAAFPEMNAGIIGFRTGPTTAKFFGLWARYYDEFRALNTATNYHYANVGDQKSLRAALWHSSVRHAAIGAEFNFIPFKLELVSLPVAVIHTRARAGLPALAGRLNAQLGRRTYSPLLDAIVSESPAGGELWRLTAGLGKLWFRAFGRAIAPRRFRDGLRRLPGMSQWLTARRFEGGSARGEERKWEKQAPRS